MSTGRRDQPGSTMQVLRRITPLYIKASPGWFAMDTFLSVVHAVSWVMTTIATQHFFGRVLKQIAGTSSYWQTGEALVWLGLAVFASQLLNGVSNFSIGQFQSKAQGYMGRIIHQKANRLDPVCYEDTKLLDHINKAEEGRRNANSLIFTVTSIFSFYLPYFLAMGGYLLTIRPLLLLVIPLVFLPVALCQIIRYVMFARLEDQAAPLRRESDAYEQAIGDRAYFKETRILGIVGFLRQRYIVAARRLTKAQWRAQRRTGLAELGMRMITLAGYLGILWLLVSSLMDGYIGADKFAAIFASIGMLFSIMEEVIARHIGYLSQNLGTIENLVRFLDLPERQGQVTLDGPRQIVLDRVTFAYPGQDQPAICDLSLTIAPGERVAIVGANGAGKSTLVRLITGIYLPTEGTCRVAGVDTRDLQPDALMAEVSGVMQKYARYQLTLRENVTISEPARAGDDVGFDQAVRQAEIKLDDSLPNGADTMLSRKFDGVDLSGGDWQRVAIARGYFRRHTLIVLDEPTAAIDPLEETRIYQQFAHFAQGKTALLVTHRMGAARIAERILVLENGRLAEQGSHAELMRLGGIYAKMVAAQSRWYQASEGMSATVAGT